jgi:hypothetical protein
MPPPEVWGPPVWTFLHTLAEHVNEDVFPKIKFSLFSYIRKICSLLPCPDCSQHALRFLAKVDINKMKNKSDLINMLYIFHNTVNTKGNMNLLAESFQRKLFLIDLKKWLIKHYKHFTQKNNESQPNNQE